MTATTDEKAVASWFEMFGLHDPDAARGSLAWADNGDGTGSAWAWSCSLCGSCLWASRAGEGDTRQASSAELLALLRLHYCLMFEVEARDGERWTSKPSA